ncbi:MAG: hypothetical protein HY897_17745 [Deltaproteobacteria bacterium]|nr:hypothetical protein [Deltaproteobacteria bacterium]
MTNDLRLSTRHLHKSPAIAALAALVVAGAAALSACETDCDKTLRELAACCARNPPDAGDCQKLNQQTFIDAGYWPDGGPDGSVDAGGAIEVPCEGVWLDYARNVENKGLDQKTCTVKP